MLHSIADIERQTDLSKTTIYALLRSGALESVKVGTRRLVTSEQLARFVESLTAAGEHGDAA